MNVLYGLYQADEGEILLDDVEQHFAGPGDAMAAGIGMVHQHFMLIPVFTAENVMLGHEQTTFGGRLDLAAARAMVREISGRFRLVCDPGCRGREPPRSVCSSGWRSSRRSHATQKCWCSTSPPPCSHRRRPTS